MSDDPQEEERQPPLTGEVMDVRGVALYLGFSPATIYSKVRDADIPHVRIGNSLRFPKSEIDRWLSQNTVRPQEPFYNYFVQMAGRFFFQKWLESRGLDPKSASPEEVESFARRSLGELRENKQQDDFYVES